jgi:hypothetical protein
MMHANINWVQQFALGLLVVQSIGWLVTLIRIVRLAAETSSASTTIVTLRDECARLHRDGGGVETRNLVSA